jgi:hypothetical protein
MTKLKKTDEVMQELWAVKDATAAKYATVGAYFSHLRELAHQRKAITVRAIKRTNASAMPPSVPPPKAE